MSKRSGTVTNQVQHSHFYKQKSMKQQKQPLLNNLLQYAKDASALNKSQTVNYSMNTHNINKSQIYQQKPPGNEFKFQNNQYRVQINPPKINGDSISSLNSRYEQHRNSIKESEQIFRQNIYRCFEQLSRSRDSCSNLGEKSVLPNYSHLPDGKNKFYTRHQSQYIHKTGAENSKFFHQKQIYQTQKIRILQTELIEYKKQRQMLKAQIEKLKKSALMADKQLIAELHKLEREIHYRQEKIQQLKREIDRLKVQNRILLEKYQQCRRKHQDGNYNEQDTDFYKMLSQNKHITIQNTTTQRIQFLKFQNHELRKDLHTNASQLESLKVKYSEQLQSLNHKFQTTVFQYQKYLKQFEEQLKKKYQKIINQQRYQVQQLKIIINNQKNEIEQYKIQNKTLYRQTEIFREQNNHLKNQKSFNQQQEIQKKRQYNNLKDRISELQSIVRSKTNELQDQKQKYQRDLNYKLQALRRETQQQKHRYQQDIYKNMNNNHERKLQQINSQYGQKILSYQSQAQKLNNIIKQKDDQLNGCKTKNNQLQKELKIKDNHIKQTANQILTFTMQKQESTNRMKSEFEEEKLKLKGQMEREKQKLEEQKLKVQRQFDNKCNSHDDLQRQKDQYLNKIRQYENKISDLQNREQQLKNNSIKTTRRIQEMIEQQTTIKQQKEELQRKLREIESQMMMFKQNSAQKQQNQVTEKLQTIQQLTLKLQTAQREYKLLRQNYDSQNKMSQQQAARKLQEIQFYKKALNKLTLNYQQLTKVQLNQTQAINQLNKKFQQTQNLVLRILQKSNQNQNIISQNRKLNQGLPILNLNRQLQQSQFQKANSRTKITNKRISTQYYENSRAASKSQIQTTPRRPMRISPLRIRCTCRQQPCICVNDYISPVTFQFSNQSPPKLITHQFLIKDQTPVERFYHGQSRQNNQYVEKKCSCQKQGHRVKFGQNQRVYQIQKSQETPNRTTRIQGSRVSIPVRHSGYYLVPSPSNRSLYEQIKVPIQNNAQRTSSRERNERKVSIQNTERIKRSSNNLDLKSQWPRIPGAQFAQSSVDQKSFIKSKIIPPPTPPPSYTTNQINQQIRASNARYIRTQNIPQQNQISKALFQSPKQKSVYAQSYIIPNQLEQQTITRIEKFQTPSTHIHKNQNNYSTAHVILEQENQQEGNRRKASSVICNNTDRQRRISRKNEAVDIHMNDTQSKRTMSFTDSQDSGIFIFQKDRKQGCC